MKFILIMLVLCLLAWVETRWSERQRRKWQREAMTTQQREEERIQGCYDVVNEFREKVGYMLSRVTTAEELESIIRSVMIWREYKYKKRNYIKGTKIQSKELQNDLFIQINSLTGLPLGYTIFDDQRLKVNIADKDQDTHIYIIGKTKGGKTNLILNFIKYLIKAGYGVGILATETEMIPKIMSIIPDERINDVYYINPMDFKYPLGFNMFHFEPSEDINFKLNEMSTIFSQMVEETSSRMKDILFHSFYTLMKIPGSTLIDLPKLLNKDNNQFRLNVISKISDSYIRDYWRFTYDKYPKDCVLPIIHRLNKMISIPESPLRNILCQRQSSFRFRQIMDQGKIFIMNIARGLMSTEDATILGKIAVANFNSALNSRADIYDELKRRKFYLILDEFQKFIQAESIEDFFSNGRRYGMRIVVAHQNSSQLSPAVFKAIMGNVGAAICFVVGRDDANRFSSEFEIERDEEIISIPAARLTGLRTGSMICKLVNRYTTELKTDFFGNKIDEVRVEQIIKASQQKSVSSKSIIVDPTQKIIQLTKMENIILNDSRMKLEPGKVFQ